MATYEYVDNTGALKTVEASDPNSAISSAKDRAATSGVSLSTSPTPATTPAETLGDALGTAGTTPYSAPTPLSEPSPYQDINEDKVRRDVLQRYQAQINATKGAYSKLLGETKQMGVGRLGETTAQQARGGLLGSDFGQAQTDKTREFNRKGEQDVLLSESSAIGAIMAQANDDARSEINAKRLANQSGYDSRKQFNQEKEQRLQDNLKKLSVSLIRSGQTPESLGSRLKDIAKTYKTTEADIINSYLNTKYEDEQMQEEEKGFTLSEGQAYYDAAGNLVASRGKTYAPTTGTSYSSSGVSSAAQDIIDIMNKQGGSIDDYVKGTSNAAQALRSEVLSGLARQGGTTEKSTALFREAKAVIDDMISKDDYKKFGFSSMVPFAKSTPGYGDMVARAQTVNAILARDNLGLLKGAMSDKDLAFIQAMSAGVPDGTITEDYAKDRMLSIQEKLAGKVGQFTPITSQESGGDEIDDFLNNI